VSGMTRCCLTTRLRKCSLRVLRLAPVARIISPTVTRPCCRTWSRDLSGQVRQCCDHEFFRPRLGPKAAASARGARAEKTATMAATIRVRAADRALGLTQGEVISHLGLLDHTFKRAVVDIGISRLEEKQRRENSAETSVAVLERMDFEEHDGKYADHEERVQALHFPNLLTPRQELGNETWRVEGEAVSKTMPTCLPV
jgi:hypothetical protein